MEEVVYSADSQLHHPGRFARGMWSDLRVSPPVAWRLFLQNLRANYRQSRLGYFWLLLPPLATTASLGFSQLRQDTRRRPDRLALSGLRSDGDRALAGLRRGSSVSSPKTLVGAERMGATLRTDERFNRARVAEETVASLKRRSFTRRYDSSGVFDLGVRAA